jgi:hypothetical protein
MKTGHNIRACRVAAFSAGLVALGLLYTSLAVRMAQTPVYDRDGLIFQADTAEVARDMTLFHTGAHVDTNIHPLFTLFVTPWGAVLAKLFGAPVAVVVLNVATGMLTALVMFLVFRRVCGSVPRAAAWTMLAALTSSQLLFVSIPERHALAAFSLALAAAAAVYGAGRLKAFVPAGIATIGVTVTNIAACGLLFVGSLLTEPHEKKRPWLRWLARAIAFTALTLGTAVLLSVIQKRIWPETQQFFRPEVYGHERDYFFIPGSLAEAGRKAVAILAHMLCFNIVAPDPSVDWIGGQHGLTFRLASFRHYSPVGAIGLAAWAGLCAASLAGLCRRGHPRRPLWTALAAVVALNIAVHMLYGDDFFIYTANWTLFVVLAAATGLAGTSGAVRRAADILLAVAVLCAAARNPSFLRSTADYLDGDASATWKQWQRADWMEAHRVGDELAENRVRGVYGQRRHTWMALPLERRITFVDVAAEQVPRFKQQLEQLSRRYAFIDNEGNINGFIAATGGRAVQTRVPPYLLSTDLHPPSPDLVAIPPAALTNVVGIADGGEAPVVVDLNLDSTWQSSAPFEQDDGLAWKFPSNVLVSTVRVFSRHQAYPRRWRVDVRRGPEADWEPVTELMGNPYYFWSGPRVFWNGKHYRLEARFEPVSARALRIVLPGRTRTQPPRLAEIRMYGPGPPTRGEPAGLADAITAIAALRPARVYADRWAATQLHRRFEGELELSLEPAVFEQRRCHPPRKPELTPFLVRAEPGSVFLVRKEESAITRTTLAAAGCAFDETVVAPWILFSIRGVVVSDPPPVYWTGTACYLGTP